MSVRSAIRFALGWLAFNAIQLGIWALLAPRHFYDTFPGFGWTWVAIDGPFNEHFVRDFGALNLALAVLLVAAYIRMSRDLVVVAAVASLVWGVPHAVYHLFNTDGLGTLDIIASVGGLIFSVVLAAGLIVTSRHLDDSNQEPVLQGSSA